MRLSSKKERGFYWQGGDLPRVWGPIRMEPSYWGRDSGVTKDAQTNSATSTFSIFMSARERWQEWVTPVVHDTQQPLIYFTPAPFFCFHDCAYEHVWHLWERKSDSAYMRKGGSHRVQRWGKDTSKQHKQQGTETQKETKCQPCPNVTLDLQVLLTSLSSLDAWFLMFRQILCARLKCHFPAWAEGISSKWSPDYKMVLPFYLIMYQTVSAL